MLEKIETRSTNVVELNKIKKSYRKKNSEIVVLSELTANFEIGKFYAIMGHSGSGKSTLINILGLIDEIDAGNYYLNGKDIKELTDNQLSNIRMSNIGFVFQNFQLDPNLKAIENVMLPMLINKNIQKKDRKELAKRLLIDLGLENRLNHFPKELSGGEQQRVAIARALVNNPEIILADEPTGNLDEKTEQEIFNTLKILTKQGKCVITVCHNPEIKKYANIVYKLVNGKLIEENL